MSQTAVDKGLETELKLTIEREFAAPPERVFAAFTEVERLKAWWGPEGFMTPEAVVDLRVGGRYRLVMQAPSGNIHVVTGEFREVTPPSRLVYSFAWEQEDGSLGHPSLVTLELEAAGKGTRLTLTQEGFSDAASRDDHRGGWSSSFECLEAYLNSDR
jgi:uncharacterized protein YndB with AHSA1/START domain